MSKTDNSGTRIGSDFPANNGNATSSANTDSIEEANVSIEKQNKVNSNDIKIAMKTDQEICNGDFKGSHIYESRSNEAAGNNEPQMILDDTGPPDKADNVRIERILNSSGELIVPFNSDVPHDGNDQSEPVEQSESSSRINDDLKESAADGRERSTKMPNENYLKPRQGLVSNEETVFGHPESSLLVNGTATLKKVFDEDARVEKLIVEKSESTIVSTPLSHKNIPNEAMDASDEPSVEKEVANSYELKKSTVTGNGNRLSFAEAHVPTSADSCVDHSALVEEVNENYMESQQPSLTEIGLETEKTSHSLIEKSRTNPELVAEVVMNNANYESGVSKTRSNENASKVESNFDDDESMDISDKRLENSGSSPVLNGSNVETVTKKLATDNSTVLYHQPSQDPEKDPIMLMETKKKHPEFFTNAEKDLVVNDVEAVEASLTDIEIVRNESITVDSFETDQLLNNSKGEPKQTSSGSDTPVDNNGKNDVKSSCISHNVDETKDEPLTAEKEDDSSCVAKTVSTTKQTAIESSDAPDSNSISVQCRCETKRKSDENTSTSENNTEIDPSLPTSRPVLASTENNVSNASERQTAYNEGPAVNMNLAKKVEKTPVNVVDPLSIDVFQDEEVDMDEFEKSLAESRSNNRATPQWRRMLMNVPKPTHFRNLNGRRTSDEESSSSSGLLADEGCFQRDDSEPGPSKSRSVPGCRSSSPPVEPPHAIYMDADYQLALRLQEEEDRRAKYSDCRSYKVNSSNSYQSAIEQFPLSPCFSSEIQIIDNAGDPDSSEQVHTLYHQCKRKYPEEKFPEPFKLPGFSPFELCEGYRQVLRGGVFPYDGVTPAVPPGSPKQPEQAAMTTSHSPYYTVVNNTNHQDLPTDINRNETAFQKFVSSTKDRMDSIPGGSSSSLDVKNRNKPGQSNGESSSSWDDHDFKPRPRERSSNFSWSTDFSWQDDSQPGPSNRPSSYRSFDDSQPGPSNRRSYSQQLLDDEEDDLKKALEMSRIEHQKMLKKQAGVPESEQAGSSSSNDNVVFRVPETPRKRRMKPLAENHEFSPLARRSFRQPSFYAVETLVEMEEPEISSTSSEDNRWPSCKWLDPENMPPAEALAPAEKRKMPQTYLRQIKIENDRKSKAIENAPAPVKKDDFELAAEKEEELEKALLENKFMDLVRSNITSPNYVPREIANTRFEIYARFPFLPRPMFVLHVLRALNIPDNSVSLDDVLDETPDYIKAMSLAEFFKYAVYIWFGLKVDGVSADKPIAEPQLDEAKKSFLDSVKKRLDDESLHQVDEEERKCAESVAVSHVHSCSRVDVSRMDIKEMQLYKKSTIDKRSLLTRHRARYGNPRVQAELDKIFRVPACIRKEEELVEAAERAAKAREAMADECTLEAENETPLGPGLNSEMMEESEESDDTQCDTVEISLDEGPSSSLNSYANRNFDHYYY